MFNFQKILNRKSDQNKSPSRSESLLSKSSDDGQDNSTGSAEGFLCPTCFAAFPTPELLQNHYESSHSESINDNSGDAMCCPVCKMRFGSDIELNSHYSRHHSGSKEEMEIEALRMQIKALEEGKALVQNELLSTRFEVTNVEKDKLRMKDERDQFELKAAQLASELADLKLNLDELGTKKTSVESCLNSYEDKIKKLEIEIQQRPEADDVNLLKQEIVSVQKMMDHMTLQREAEKETLQKQCDNLQETCLRLQAEKSDLENQLKVCPKKEEVKSLEDRLSAMSTNIYQLQREVDAKESERSKLQITLEKYANYDEMRTQLSEKDTLLQESVRSSNEKDKLIDKLKIGLLAEKEAVEEMKTGFEKLYQKIEQGEGVNSAIVQLQEENARLQEQFLIQQTQHGRASYEAETQNRELNSLLKKANLDLQALKEKNKEEEEDLASARQEIGALKLQKENLSKELTLQISSLTASDSSGKVKLQKLEEDLEQAKVALAAKKQKLENLQNHYKEENEAHVKEHARLEFERHNLESKCAEQAEILQRFQTSLTEGEKKITELEKKLHESNEACNLKERNILALSNELQKVKTTYEELHLKFRNMENVMVDSQAMNSEFNEKLAALNEELSVSLSKETELNAAIENMNEVKLQMNEKVLTLDEENRNLKSCLGNLQSEKDSISSKYEALKQEVLTNEKKCTEQENKITKLEGLYSEEKKKVEELQDDFESAKQLLLNQKLKMQEQLDGFKKDHEKQISSVQDKVKSQEKELEIGKKKTNELNAMLEKAKKDFQLKEKNWEETTSQQIGQIGVLTENIKTLREDLQSEQTKRESLEKELYNISGNKLELEAKLENALDERRGLLERCLRNESECERLQKSSADVHRKYEDCVAALQELGRENQTLQVENMKHITRKWADDSEVTNCTSCQKLFTVTIRKHHCRSCGNIFCNECSAKNATVASSKKPVRVCEACFEDLTK